MPIKPENRQRYPANWKAIREQIRVRAKDRCEWCEVPNHEIIHRDEKYINGWRILDAFEAEAMAMDGIRTAYIVCTVAHLDHQPEHNNPENLAFLCQRCHNRYDAPHRAKTRRRTRAQRSNQQELSL